MAAIWVIGFQMTDEQAEMFTNMATAIFRAAGEPARRMDIFLEFPFHGEGYNSQMCWARAIWYVFCQIYAGEHDVDESFLANQCPCQFLGCFLLV